MTVNRTASQALPPHVQLIQMGTASWVSAVVYAAAKLGIADRLAAGPRSAAELAGPTRTHAPSLHRLMRTLAGLGILTERDAQRFALTSLGEALKTDAPGSARATLIAFCGQAFWHSWEEIVYSLETGKTGFERACGMPLFDYLAQHPQEASYFSEAMVGYHGAEPPAVARAYDFSRLETIVDVGGATGNMLAAILSQHAAPRGVLYDRPHVVSDAPALLKARGVEARVTIEPGDFFERVPAGGDAYLLSHIIHDWNEEQCLTILGHCRNGHQTRWPPPDRRDRPANGRYASSRQGAGHGHAGRSWRPGTHRGRIRFAPRQERLPSAPRRAHGVHRECGGGGSGVDRDWDSVGPALVLRAGQLPSESAPPISTRP